MNISEIGVCTMARREAGSSYVIGTSQIYIRNQIETTVFPTKVHKIHEHL